MSANLEDSAVTRGLEKVTFHSSPKEGAVQKSVRIIGQLHSFCMLVRLYSKSFKLVFSNTWTENFQMYKLNWAKAEELEIKLQTSIGIIGKTREFQENICLIDYIKAFDYVDHNKLENSQRDGNTRPPYLSPEKPVCGSRSNS